MEKLRLEKPVFVPLRKDKKITFRLDQTRCSDLESIADTEGVSVSFIVRHLVCRYLEDHKRTSSVEFIFPGGVQ